MLMLAAGSALAAVSDGTLENPATLTWEDLTLTKPANGELTSGSSVLNWSEDPASLLSWELTLTVTVNTVADKQAGVDTLFQTHGSGFKLNVGGGGKIFLTGSDKSSTRLLETSTSVVTPGSNSETNTVNLTLSFTNYKNLLGEDIGGIFKLYVGDTEAASYEVTDSEHTNLIKNGESKIWTNTTNNVASQTYGNIALKHGGSIIIPEPATATLSLLALAGLAARRRRR